MQNTTKSLADLRDHWNKEGCPSIANIAKSANVPSSTAHRYITGATKGGAPETIRALAIAMGRPDIADDIPYSGLGNNSQSNDYLVELNQQWQERLQQQLAESATKHRQDLETLARDHRAEREEWHAQHRAMHEESSSLRAAFEKAISFRDAQLRIARIEKWTLALLLLAAVVALIVN